MPRGKKIFISHNQNDAEFANRVCAVLEAHGMECLIAPRDIPYGEVWAADITRQIRDSALMLLIYTQHSNRSAHVLREICIADDAGVGIIALKLTDEEYNLALKYYLCILQWVSLSPDARAEELDAFAEQIKSKLSDGKPGSPGGAPPTLPDLNDEINAAINDNTSATTQEKLSPFKKKLFSLIQKNFSENIFTFPHDTESDSPENTRCAKHFTVLEKAGATCAFLVRKQIAESDYSVSYTAEPLKKEISNSGLKEKTVNYIVGDIDLEGNPIVTVTILREQSAALVNMGFVFNSEPTLSSDGLEDENEIYISDKPQIMELKALSPGNTQKLCKFPISNPGGTVIIDPDDGSVLPCKREFDSRGNKWSFFAEIVPSKGYLVLNLTPDDTRGTAADPFTVAYGYYKGKYGLAKNIVNAAVWFEKCGSRKAYFYLHEIFSADPLLADKNSARYYMDLYLNAED